jgi:hypothetical protein
MVLSPQKKKKPFFAVFESITTTQIWHRIGGAKEGKKKRKKMKTMHRSPHVYIKVAKLSYQSRACNSCFQFVS